MQNLRFNALLADMPLGVCMFDKAGQLAISNDRYLQMYRLEPEVFRVVAVADLRRMPGFWLGRVE